MGISGFSFVSSILFASIIVHLVLDFFQKLTEQTQNTCQTFSEQQIHHLQHSRPLHTLLVIVSLNNGPV